MNATIKLGVSSVLLMLGGGLAAYAPTASAQVAPGQLRSTGNGRCLAVIPNPSAVNLQVATQPCNALSAQQRWAQELIPGTSVFRIRNIGTSPARCLDINAGTIFASPCNTAVAGQRWVRQITTGGLISARFRSVSNGRYLDNTSAGVVYGNTNLVPSGLGAALQIWAY
jgi:hypothetical protein